MGAKFGCSTTLSATREFAGIAWVINLVVVPTFLRRGILVCICAVANIITSHEGSKVVAPLNNTRMGV